MAVICCFWDSYGWPSGTWWHATDWLRCERVRYYTAKTKRDVARDAWLRWADGAEVVKLAPDPDAPSGWDRRYGCTRLDRRNRIADFEWGTVEWGKSHSEGAVFTIGGHEIECGYLPDDNVSTMALAGACIAGSCFFPESTQADIRAAWENRKRKPGPRPV